MARQEILRPLLLRPHRAAPSVAVVCLVAMGVTFTPAISVNESDLDGRQVNVVDPDKPAASTNRTPSATGTGSEADASSRLVASIRRQIQRLAEIRKRRDLSIQLQNDLKAAGFDPGPIDGFLGSSTMKAIEAFKKRYPQENPTPPITQQTVKPLESDPLRVEEAPLATRKPQTPQPRVSEQPSLTRSAMTAVPTSTRKTTEIRPTPTNEMRTPTATRPVETSRTAASVEKDNDSTTLVVYGLGIFSLFLIIIGLVVQRLASNAIPESKQTGTPSSSIPRPSNPDSCPHGHGPLQEWEGRKRCWTCGWHDVTGPQSARQELEKSGQFKTNSRRLEKKRKKKLARQKRLSVKNSCGKNLSNCRPLEIKEFSLKAVKSQQMLDIEFSEANEVFKAIETTLKEEMRMTKDSAFQFTSAGFVLACPTCGEYNDDTCFLILNTSPGGVFDSMKCIVFGGPNVAALGSGRCPGCGGTKLIAAFSPTVANQRLAG